MQAIGIRRAVKHSPNHINNDATIFQMVADRLAAGGVAVKAFHEHEFLKAVVEPNGLWPADCGLIFSMSRNPEVLSALKQLHQLTQDTNQRVKIINSITGIEHCFRSNITRLLQQYHIPAAPSAIMPSTGYDPAQLDTLDQGHGLWLKRGDFHAIVKEDVVFAADPAAAKELLAAFAARGIQEVVVSSHLKGDLVKFYGVQGTDFFHWLYPYDKGHYKYKEFQAINGQTRYFDFDQQQLQRIATQVALEADVPIYGGDAVVDDEGHLSIIDFNDWPSFAPCRDQAADAISSLLLSSLSDTTKTTSSVNESSYLDQPPEVS